MLYPVSMAKEHTIDLQLHGSYTVDTNRIKESERIKENTPFTFFIQTGINSNTKERLLNMYDLELPKELLADIYLYNKNGYIILTFGREVKEVTYKFLNKTGISANAKVTFCEEYQENTMFAYFIAEEVSFHEEIFYIMKDSKKVYWGEGRVGTVYAEELERK